jgi:hypothetical protein
MIKQKDPRTSLWLSRVLYQEKFFLLGNFLERAKVQRSYVRTLDFSQVRVLVRGTNVRLVAPHYTSRPTHLDS